MRIPTRRTSTLFVASFFVLTSLNFPTVCREEGGNEYNASAIRAHRVLAPNISDPTKAVIYIEKIPDGLYFHSNFVAPGYDFTNPTKIPDEDITDVSEAFFNIRLPKVLDLSAQNRADQIYRDDLQLLLDRSVFSEGAVHWCT